MDVCLMNTNTPVYSRSECRKRDNERLLKYPKLHFSSTEKKPKHKKCASHHVWHSYSLSSLWQIHHFTLNPDAKFLSKIPHHHILILMSQMFAQCTGVPFKDEISDKLFNILVQFVRHPVVYCWNLKQFHKMTEHLDKNYWGYMKTRIQQRR